MNENKNTTAVAARNLTVGSILSDGFVIERIGSVGMMRGSLYARVYSTDAMRYINQAGTQHVLFLAP